MEFKEYAFKDLLINVVDNRGKTCPTAEAGLPLIATNCIKNNALYPVHEKVRFVDNDTYENWFRGHPKPGDIIFVCKGSPGRVCWTPDPVNFCIAQDMLAIRADETKIHPKYLLALLRSEVTQRKILNMHVGTLIPHFKKGDFGNLYFDIPEDMEFQKKVGEAYFEFCNKIELNCQTNQTLEEMAQAVFKSWFVDFEPTRAKIKARENGKDPTRAAMAAIAGKTVDQLDTLSPEQIETLAVTADLFPDALMVSDLGDVPDGWEAGELKDIAEFSTDRVDVSNLTLQNYISTENMLEGKRGISSASSLPSAKSVPEFDVGQILISNIRPYFMKIWLARFQGGRSNDVLGLEAKEAGGTEYLYNLLYQDKFFEFMMTTSKGAKMPRGDKDAIMGWRCVHPRLEVKEAYSKLVGGFYTQIEAKNDENKSLEQLRDTLLPKLLSGEVDLSEAV